MSEQIPIGGCAQAPPLQYVNPEDTYEFGVRPDNVRFWRNEDMPHRVNPIVLSMIINSHRIPADLI